MMSVKGRNLSNSFGKRLAEAIKVSRQHHNHVATRIGVTRGRLSDILKEKEKPNTEEIELLAELLATSPTWLITGKHPR